MQVAPNRGRDTVGADQDIASLRPAVAEQQCHTPIVRLEADRFARQLDLVHADR